MLGSKHTCVVAGRFVFAYHKLHAVLNKEPPAHLSLSLWGESNQRLDHVWEVRWLLSFALRRAVVIDEPLTRLQTRSVRAQKTK